VVKGADRKAVKAYLRRFPLDDSTTKSEVRTALAERDREVAALEKEVVVLRSQVAKIPALTAQVAENSALSSEVAKLREENSLLKWEPKGPAAPTKPSIRPAGPRKVARAAASVDEIIPGSVASAFSAVLKKWLGAKSPLELLWKSSDPRDVDGFHRACDGRGNTLVVVRSKEGNIFGGFAVPAWDSSSC
jgi:hypothetical protein